MNALRVVGWSHEVDEKRSIFENDAINVRAAKAVVVVRTCSDCLSLRMRNCSGPLFAEASAYRNIQRQALSQFCWVSRLYIWENNLQWNLQWKSSIKKHLYECTHYWTSRPYSKEGGMQWYPGRFSGVIDNEGLPYQTVRVIYLVNRPSYVDRTYA